MIRYSMNSNGTHLVFRKMPCYYAGLRNAGAMFSDRFVIQSRPSPLFGGHRDRRAFVRRLGHRPGKLPPGGSSVRSSLTGAAS